MPRVSNVISRGNRKADELARLAVTIQFSEEFATAGIPLETCDLEGYNELGQLQIGGHIQK